MQTDPHWNHILSSIKQKGKRTLRIRKTLKTASLSLILLVSALFFYQTPRTSEPSLANQSETSYEVAILLEDAGFYDDELGFISD